MAQNITLMGASYTNVPAVNLPKTGGGTASFTDVTDTTATASDVASGKYFYTANGTRTAGTSSGGGGASDIIEGTFKFTNSSAAAQTVTLNYNGNGYPIVCAIVLDEEDGVLNPTYTNTVARYSIAQYFMTKTYMDETPTYATSGNANMGAVASVYKSSTSTAATLTRTSNASVNTFSSSNSTGSTTQCVRFKSKTTMSIYSGATSGTSRYGFFNGLTYRYWIIYSE